jgi:hypothetical protein
MKNDRNWERQEGEYFGEGSLEEKENEGDW